MATDRTPQEHHLSADAVEQRVADELANPTITYYPVEDTLDRSILRTLARKARLKVPR